MKKFLLTTVFSLGLLATPAWGVWYTADDRPFEVDTDRGTVSVKATDVNIYFRATTGSKRLKGTDVDDKVSELEDLLRGKRKELYTITFMRPINNKHLSFMEATLIKFELNYENIGCEDAAPGIKTAWDALYQKTKRQIDQEEDEKQERHRANQEDYDDFLESNGPGVGIMKAIGGYFSGSDSDGDGSYDESSDFM